MRKSLIINIKQCYLTCFLLNKQLWSEALSFQSGGPQPGFLSFPLSSDPTEHGAKTKLLQLGGRWADTVTAATLSSLFFLLVHWDFLFAFISWSTTKNVTQLVKRLPNIHKALGQTPSTHEPGIRSSIYGKFEDSLGYMIHCLNITKMII